jgi:hypothetical protein
VRKVKEVRVPFLLFHSIPVLFRLAISFHFSLLVLYLSGLAPEPLSVPHFSRVTYTTCSLRGLLFDPKMETESCSETSANLCWSTCHHSDRRVNLKPNTAVNVRVPQKTGNFLTS